MDNKTLTDAPLWAQLSGKVTIGSVFGYMMGNFLKQITDEMIFYAGLSASLIGGLAWMRWISIEWKQIDADLLHIYNRAKSEAD